MHASDFSRLALRASTLFPLLALTSAFTFDCNHIRISETSFDLSPLGGPRSVLHSVDQGLSLHNTTFTIDLCKGLLRKQDVPKEHQCPLGTRVCAIERLLNKEEETDTLERVIPIAGELRGKGGDDMNAKWAILGSSSSIKSGLSLEMNGGFFGAGKNMRPQKAIVKFICDKERTGLENLWTPEAEDQYTESESERRFTAADKDDAEKQEKDNEDKVDEKDKPSLEYVKYEEGEGDTDVLKLRWRTKYACAGAQRDLEQTKRSWGLFTWFILIAFLSTAAYIIFGSWLNYNRYSARGWDLLPHGDAIRDVPYLLKDWSRRVLNTVQGHESRGGYAAV